METWTIKKLLDWLDPYFKEKGVDVPRISAEMLLAYVLEMKRIDLYVHFDKPVAKPQLDRLHDLVKRAAAHEPIQYLTGMAEFYSIGLSVSPACLIPRPETEQLVDRAVDFLRSCSEPRRVCDVCTGSGCIAIAIAKNVSDTKVVATDISEEALGIAQKNVERYELQDRVQLLQGEFFDPVVVLKEDGFDLVTANPPYVNTKDYGELAANVREFEPELALHAGEDGLDCIGRIASEAPGFLKPSGMLLMEIAYDQGAAVRKLLEEAGAYSDIIVEKDFAGRERLAIAKRK